MKKLPEIIVTIALDSMGEETKRRWFGQFRIKRKLTNSERFALERIYSQLLPPSGREVPDELKLRAAAIAELSVRVDEGPDWWQSSRGGQLLIDSTPIYDLINLCHKEEENWNKSLEEEASEPSNAIPKSDQP